MTVRLNDRLATIASCVLPGESVCDIGTDHGFLPIWLVTQGGHYPVIMSDVSKGSLEKAVSDAKAELDEGDVPDARCGDGLDVLAPGEVDDIVIAGMGGLQILDILSWDFIKTLSYRKYILQPRRDAALLRKWLETNGFTVTDQFVAPEKSRYSEVICVTTDGAKSVDIDFFEHEDLIDVFGGDPEKLAEYEYPEGLRSLSGKGIVKDYFESELAKERMIIGRIVDNSTKAASNTVVRMHRARIERLESMLTGENQ